MSIITNLTQNLELHFTDGTTPLETYSLSFFVPLSSLLLSMELSKFNYICKNKKDIIEIIAFNLVLLLALTLFCDYIIFLFMILCLRVFSKLFRICLQLSDEQWKKIKKSIFEIRPLQDFNEKFIGDYRGHLLLATATSILAVDFAIFPERFSKTETYGWSVMDAGVGSFVLIHGLCSSSSRKSVVLKSSLKKCLLSSFPLFMLGVIRLVVTTAVGYHKVVPEYGVHWNFFFTLAITKVLCYLIEICFAFIPSGISALVVIVVHQTLLSKGLTTFILSESRENFIEANKEGICSLLGFVSIYFFGVQLGKLLWRRRDTIIEFINLFFNIIAIGIFGWTLMYVIHTHVQQVSRRMANLAYCIWVVTIVCLQIAIHLAHNIVNFFLHQVLQNDISSHLLWKAINYNGLSYFLLANVLTGLVNLAIKTEYCDDFLSFIILCFYLTGLTIPIIVLYNKSIQLKFW